MPGQGKEARSDGKTQGMALRAAPPGGAAVPRRGLCLREGGGAAAPPGARSLPHFAVSFPRVLCPFPAALPCACRAGSCTRAGPEVWERPGGRWAEGEQRGRGASTLINYPVLRLRCSLVLTPA